MIAFGPPRRVDQPLSSAAMTPPLCRHGLAALLLALLVACAPHDETAPAQVEADPEPAPAMKMAAPDRPPADPPATVVSESPDPYQGWEQWCEPQWQDVQCKKTADCLDVDHPSPRSLTCMVPYWARHYEDKPKFCVAGFHRPGEKEDEEARVLELLHQQYFDVSDRCAFDGRPMHEEHWRCQRDPGRLAARALHRYLWMVMIRESGARPWKRHSLPADQKANKSSWATRSKHYGWAVNFTKDGDVKSVRRTANDPNEHYRYRRRWMGLGYYGQNSPLWVRRWDPHAPPEIMCRRVESTEAYLRKARSVIRKWETGQQCAGETYVNTEPTWFDVHRAVSSGKSCPPRTEKAQRRADLSHARLMKRGKQVGLDVDHRVTLASFGRPIPKAGQNERAQELREAIAAKRATSAQPVQVP